MTDHPRFQIVTNDPDWCYREHHGTALVAWVFGAADWWLSRRARRPFAAGASAPQSTSDLPYPSLVESTP